LSENGRGYIVEEYSFEAAVRRYTDILRKLKV